MVLRRQLKDFFSLTVVSIEVKPKPLMTQFKDRLWFNMVKVSRIGMMGALMKACGRTENKMDMVLGT